MCHLPRVPSVTYLSEGVAGIQGYLLCVQGQTSSAVTGSLAEAVFLRPEVNKLGHSHVHSWLIPQLWPSLLAEVGAILGTRAGELTKMERLLRERRSDGKGSQGALMSHRVPRASAEEWHTVGLPTTKP